jgi:hypothetical protein
MILAISFFGLLKWYKAMRLYTSSIIGCKAQPFHLHRRALSSMIPDKALYEC